MLASSNHHQTEKEKEQNLTGMNWLSSCGTVDPHLPPPSSNWMHLEKEMWQAYRLWRYTNEIPHLRKCILRKPGTEMLENAQFIIKC